MARSGVIYKGLTLLVDYDYLRSHRGTREHGLLLDPDEPEDIQINEIYLVCDCHNETEITQIMSSRDFHEIEVRILSGLRQDWAEMRYEENQARREAFT